MSGILRPSQIPGRNPAGGTGRNDTDPVRRDAALGNVGHSVSGAPDLNSNGGIR